MNHRIESESGHILEFVVDGGRIAEIRGDWPPDQDELVFTSGVPPHTNVEDVPEHVRAYAIERGMDDVCFYDGDGCLTCFCDAAGHMHCRKIC